MAKTLLKLRDWHHVCCHGCSHGPLGFRTSQLLVYLEAQYFFFMRIAILFTHLFTCRYVIIYNVFC